MATLLTGAALIRTSAPTGPGALGILREWDFFFQGAQGQRVRKRAS